MIGVIADLRERAAIREFFELFKCPWELYRPGGRYDIVLCSGDKDVPERRAALTIIYAGRQIRFDVQRSIKAADSTGAGVLSLNGFRFPIYGDSIMFRQGTGHSPLLIHKMDGRTVARIGYDLFAEVHTLLTTGQPVTHAGFPTLDLHICVLRSVIVTSGVRLLEIPPVPDGHRFVACLTHDLDHPLLRRHKLDRTMWGFLYRATLGSLIRMFRGRLPVRGLLLNWAAALKLPLVHVGLAKDFWQDFDRYTELENGAVSTFFVIPVDSHAGRNAPRARAARYCAADIRDKLRALRSAGCEIALHGIDAWHNTANACAESEEIRRVTGQREIGSRMHWLYYSGHSPVNLEQAGLIYDSTIGYNETIGYRAGTTQVYKPLQTRRLLEVPLHIMDTALFYTRYLDLSDREARERVGTIIGSAVELGGCVTVNWHDRSIAPERQWDAFYKEVVEELRRSGATFLTAADAVAWFRMRRSAVFQNVTWESDAVRARIAVNAYTDLPALQLRIHYPEARPVTAAINRQSAGCRREYTVNVSFSAAQDHSAG